MNKVVLGIVAAVVVLGGIGFAVMNMNKKDDNKNSTTTSQPSTSSTDNMANMNSTDTSASSNSNDSSTQATATSDVVMQNTAFSPAKITVKVGTKVTWTNKDSVQHDVSPDQDYGDDFKGSELLSKGETYSFTFTKAGTYTYHCTPHPFMKATVVVTE